MTVTYGSFIADERIQVGDQLKYTHDEQVGDGATTLFLASASPIGTTTLAVKQAGTTLTEGTGASGYTVDYQRGAITFATAPTTGATVTADYQREVLTDNTWKTIVDDSIRSLVPDFFKEVVDDTAATTVAYQKEYPMPTTCVDLYNVWYKETSANTEDWKTLTSAGYNWRYNKDENTLLLGNTIPTTGYPLRYHYIAGYTVGTATDSTIDVQDRFKTVLQYKVRESYWQYRLQEKVNITSSVTQERTVTPLQLLIQVADYWNKKYEMEARKLKPTKPAKALNRLVQGGGIA